MSLMAVAGQRQVESSVGAVVGGENAEAQSVRGAAVVVAQGESAEVTSMSKVEAWQGN